MKRIKRSPYELVVVTVVVVLAIVLGASLYASRAKYRKGRLLVQELGAMRSAITTFRVTNGKNPAELEDLVTSEYEIGGVKRPFLERLPMSGDGRLVDPFGNPYAYDPSTGWVSGSTPDYERW